MWRKMAMLLCMSVHPFAVNFTSASISSALPIYAGSPIFGLPPKPFSTLTHLAAVNILMLGFSNLWWVPLALVAVALVVVVSTAMGLRGREVDGPAARATGHEVLSRRTAP